LLSESCHINSGIDRGEDSFIQIAVTLLVEESYNQIAVSDETPSILGLLTCGTPKETWDESPSVAKSEEVEVKVIPGLRSPARYLSVVLWKELSPNKNI